MEGVGDIKTQQQCTHATPFKLKDSGILLMLAPKKNCNKRNKTDFLPDVMAQYPSSSGPNEGTKTWRTWSKKDMPEVAMGVLRR